MTDDRTEGQAADLETEIAEHEAITDDELPLLDAATIIDEAEQLLRESAPHDFDLLVIGGGAGGCATALRAARLGSHVGLVEASLLGGASLNYGDVAVRILLAAVSHQKNIARAADLGLSLQGQLHADFGAMCKRKNGVVATLRDSLETSLTENGVEIIRGSATFIGDHTVQVDGYDGPRRISAVHIVIAVGREPSAAPIDGAELPGVMTPKGLVEREKIPRSLVLSGQGSLTVELATVFQALGTRTSLVAPEQCLPGEDYEFRQALSATLMEAGVTVLERAHIERIALGKDELMVDVQSADRRISPKSLAAEWVCLDNGSPATKMLGLSATGIECDESRIIVDENCETSVAGVYAIGGCTRDYAAVELSIMEGNMVADRILRHAFVHEATDCPIVYRTDPPLAYVGLSESFAFKKGFNARSGKHYFAKVPAAAIEGHTRGWVKVVVDIEADCLLGCQVFGENAAEIVNIASMAIRSRLSVDEISSTVFASPSYSEALTAAVLDSRAH